MELNEEKRMKFMENAGKRVNKVMHDIQILEPMARSTTYDFTKNDVEEMFFAMQDALNQAKAEFDKKFEEKAKQTRKVFTFGASNEQSNFQAEEVVANEEITEQQVENNDYNQNDNMINC